GGVSPDGKWVALVERQADSKSSSGAPNSSGGPATSTQHNAPQSAQVIPQSPPATTSSAPPASTGNSKKDEKARQKAAKEQVKEAQEMMKEMNKRITGGKKMDRAEIERMAEQSQRNAERLQKLYESGDIGKVMEMSTNIAKGSPLMVGAVQPPVIVELWDVNAASETRSLPGKPSLLTNWNGSSLTFNNDGSLFASATGGPSFKINEVASGREIFTLSLPRSYWVDRLAWSADGRMLASSQMEARAGVNFNNMDSVESYTGLFDQTIKLWDAAAGREMRNKNRHQRKPH